MLPLCNAAPLESDICYLLLFKVLRSQVRHHPTQLHLGLRAERAVLLPHRRLQRNRTSSRQHCHLYTRLIFSAAFTALSESSRLANSNERFSTLFNLNLEKTRYLYGFFSSEVRNYLWELVFERLMGKKGRQASVSLEEI